MTRKAPMWSDEVENMPWWRRWFHKLTYWVP
jgi:hypothetical protein